MRFASIKLEGYIGIYNGLGLEKIYIDFRKCKYNILIIKGLNGSGKSTLMDALTPLPDSNDKFIPNHPAKKEIEIDSGNVTYKIRFIHGIKSNGQERESTKAYIKKYIDGDVIELNPNGNVGSYKDILYSEFNLDPNFVQLSQLSSEDKGIVDKTPSERKRFMNSIINTLQVYNDIHKTLTKRASSFKSIVNRLISKIDNIGNEENISLALTSIEKRINDNMSNRSKLLEELSSYKSTIKLIDPDGSIQNSYNIIYNNIDKLNNDMYEFGAKINKLFFKLKINNKDANIDSITKLYIKNNEMINDVKNNIFVLDNEINYLLSDREIEAKSIKTKMSKLDSLKSDKNFNDICEMIKMYKIKIREYIDIFNKIGFRDKITLTKDEYIIGLNTLKEIKDIIDNMKSSIDYNILNETVDNYIKKNKKPNINEILDLIDSNRNKLKELEINLQNYMSLLNISKILESRPSKCTIDDCNFIKEALMAHKENPEDKVNKILLEIKNIKNVLSELEIHKNNLININECYINISRILRSINNNNSILNRLPNVENIIDNNIFLDRIVNGDSFDEINTLYSYIQYCDIFEDYNLIKNNLQTLENEYKIYESKHQIVDELIVEIDELNSKLNDITSKIENNRNLILDNKIKLTEYEDLKEQYENLIKYLEIKNNLDVEKSNLLSQFYNIKNNMEIIKNSSDNILRLNSLIDDIDKTISPLIEDRDELKHSLKLLKEYKEDLNIYNTKYEKIQNIKTYCSPTTGIQLLFIELYMNKTLSMANELLSLIFDGQFVIQPYVVNESEFRIPCTGGGLPRDDISSLSTSQKCIISMILSFVLLKQSSTKYNILKLDEIDAALDQPNRINFVHLLRQKMNLLDVEQCIMVSHNSEFNLANCDLILLKTAPGQNYDGNIIYKYN